MPEGLFIDYWRLLANKSDLTIEFVPMEFKEMLAQVENGGIDAPLAYFHFNNMEETLNYIKPLASVINDIYIKKSSIDELTDDNIKMRTIAVLENSMYFKFLTTNYPSVTPITFNTVSQMHKLLADPDVDGFFGERQASWQYLYETNQQTNYQQINLPSFKNNFYLVTPKENKELTNKISSAASLISPQEFTALTHKWLSPESTIQKAFKNSKIKTTKATLLPQETLSTTAQQTRQKKQSVTVNLFAHFPPYVIEDDSAKGLLTDLIEIIFANTSLELKPLQHSKYREINSVLFSKENIDAALVTTKRNKDFFYSDNLLTVDNLVLAKKDLLHPIDTINDLKRYNVIGFKGANRALGSPFKYSISNTSNDHFSYRELNSKLQIQALIDGIIDAVIIDKNVAIWELAKFDDYSLEDFQIYNVFPRTSPLYLAFRDQRIATSFNEQLRELKRSGAYLNLVDDYLSNRIIFKRDTSVKLAKILQEIIDNKQQDLLLNNLTALQESSFIKRISIDEQPTPYRLPIPLKAIELNSSSTRYLNIAFNDSVIDQQSKELGHNLDTNSLQLLDNFVRYQQAFNLSDTTNKALNFTPQELTFIKNNSVISYTEVDWPPLIVIEGDSMIGPIAEYLAIIEDLSGLQFELEHANDWEAVKAKFVEGKSQLIPSVDSAIPPHRVSIPYTEFNYALLTQKEHRYYNTMEELRGKTVVVVGASSPIVEQVRKQYPSITVITSETTQGAISKVRTGEADAYLGHIITAMNHVQNKFPDLKIAGVTDFKYTHRFLVQQDLPLLLSIINKSIAAITFQQHQAVRDKWLKVDVNPQVDYTVVYQIIVAFVSVFIAVLFFIKTLLKANKSAAIANAKLTTTVGELTQMQSELNGTIEHLKSTQQQLIAAEKMASLGSLVAGIAHEINTPVGVGLTGISHFQAITTELTEKYQQQKMKKSDFDNYIETSNQAATLIRNNLERTAELVRSFKQISVDQSSDEQRTFNVNEYIHQTLTSIHNAIKRKDLTIKVSCSDSIVISSYPGSISQIITNLVLNASIHAFEEESSLKRIEIKVTRHDDNLKLVVSDNGKGISPNIKQKIFDPFFTTNRDNGGSGLGLNIIFNLITSQLKGEITCESNLGYGAKFLITFPTTFK